MKSVNTGSPVSGGRRYFALAAGALMLATGFSAAAGSLAISPLRLTFSKGVEIASITIENTGTEETLVQTEIFSWKQLNGESKLAATDDVVAVPPVLRLAPGTQRQIRVGLTRAFTENYEQTFRVTVTEVPTKTGAGMVAVAVRHSLPIFVQPANPIAPLVTVKKHPGNAGLALDISNTGTQHLRIHRWRLRDAAGTLLAEDSGPGYVLAGSSQVLKLPVQSLSGPAIFEADNDNKPLKINVAP